MSVSAVRPATRTHPGDGDAMRRRSGRVPLLTLLFSVILMTLVAACGQDADQEERPGISPPGSGSTAASAGAAAGSSSAQATGASSTVSSAGRAAARAGGATAGTGRATAPGTDYRIDTKVNWYHFTALKCGTPAGNWDLKVDGTFDLGGGTLVLNGQGKAVLDATSLQGPWNAHYEIKLQGVPVTIGGQDASVAGSATLAGNVLQIRSQVGRGSFFSQTPALALQGPAGNPAQDFDLPVQTGRFC